MRLWEDSPSSISVSKKLHVFFLPFLSPTGKGTPTNQQHYKSVTLTIACIVSFWEKKKVVVTGGYGFIGSHLVERLLDAGANVKVADFAPRKGGAGKPAAVPAR